MKKLSVLAFALVMAVSASVFAAEEYSLGNDVTVDNSTYTTKMKGTEKASNYSYNHAVKVNGTTYPAGTKFEVIKINGQWVPTTAHVAGGAAAGGAGVGAGVAAGTAGVSTTVVIAAVAVAGVAAAAVSNTTVTHNP